MNIDCHTHAFADAIAEKAIAALHSRMPKKYYTSFDGRLSTLCTELRKNNFDKAFLCQIATKPTQWIPILNWSKSIENGSFGEDAAKMIIPLPSVHPADPDYASHLDEIAKAGFKGVKLHPYYQSFILDAPNIIDYFKTVRDKGLFAIIHDGFDIGFKFDNICSPQRVRNLLDAVPGLRLMISHFGGWMDWDNANRFLIGTPVDIEISMTVGFCRPELMREMLMRHPADHIYFGSDWPWSRHEDILKFLDTCAISPERRAALLGGNAEKFLAGNNSGI